MVRAHDASKNDQWSLNLDLRQNFQWPLDLELFTVFIFPPPNPPPFQGGRVYQQAPHVELDLCITYECTLPPLADVPADSASTNFMPTISVPSRDKEKSLSDVARTNGFLVLYVCTRGHPCGARLAAVLCASFRQ